jgi:hypothetical protein
MKGNAEKSALLTREAPKTGRLREILYPHAAVARFIRRKTSQLASLFLAGRLLSGVALAGPPSTSRTQTNTEERPSFLGLLPWSEIAKSPAEVRRLSASPHPLATKQLLWLADEELTSSNHPMRLAIVEGLHQRSEGTQRGAIVRRLIQYFVQGQPEEARQASKLSQDIEVDASILRVRGSAALSLAQSGRDDALLVLLAYEKEGVSQNPTGTLLAKSALRVFPPSREQRLSLGFAPAAPTSQTATTNARNALPQSPQALATLSISPKSWTSALLQVADAQALPAEFLEPSSWRGALAAHPLWSLRALTCLSAQRLPNLRNLALKTARQQLRASAPELKASAAWAISALADDSPSRLIESDDAAVLGAVLRQSISGELARRAFHFGRSQNAPTKALSSIATVVSMFEATTWGERSNGDLWALDEPNPFSQVWLAPLTVRAISAKTSLPQGHQIRVWLERGDSHQRSATALGLGYADSPIARGLLVKAYREELDPTVRRSITRALASQPEDNRTILRLIAEIDPDGGCRSRARGTADEDARGFLVTTGAKDTVVFVNREAQQIPLLPDPDGFVGIVDENF